jgi:hypothetical protein
MRGLEPPSAASWRSRNDWFWRAHDINAGPQPLDLDPQATALLAELELVFCAGAWASVVILAWTLVEAAERRAAHGDETPAADVDWLREQRNRLVHVSAASTEFPDEAALEAMAQGAVRVVFKTLFAHAWAGPAR